MRFAILMPTARFALPHNHTQYLSISDDFWQNKPTSAAADLRALILSAANSSKPAPSWPHHSGWLISCGLEIVCAFAWGKAVEAVAVS